MKHTSISLKLPSQLSRIADALLQHTVTSLFVFLFLHSLALALPIDTFDTKQEVQGVTGGEVRQSTSGPGILGGSRTVVTKSGNPKVAIGPFFYSSINETHTILRHSLDAGERGSSLIFWDGDNDAQLDPQGLGNLDLSSDGATGFELLVRFFDNVLPLPIEITVFTDANRFSKYQIVLNQSVDSTQGIPGAVKEKKLLFPFAAFSAAGLQGGCQFDKVGAISLEILGEKAPAVDLDIDFLSTNGVCNDIDAKALTFMPNTLLDLNGSKVILDECGVCGGDNSSCADCRGIPNGGATIDQCGICGGDNSSCSDCLGIPNGKAKLDFCGICDGDGSSCIDCFGELNGLAKEDACGVCGGDNSSCADCKGVPYGNATLDVCGVCGGDGSSCIDCNGTLGGDVISGTPCKASSFGACAEGVLDDNCKCRPSLPSTEVCDEVDNDCDGQIDEGQVCLIANNACVSSILDDPFLEIRDEGNAQMRLLKYVIRNELRLVSSSDNPGSSVLRRGERLRNRIRRILSSLQDYDVVYAESCGCAHVSVSSKLHYLDQNSRRWEGIIRNLVDRILRKRQGGVCEGSIDECRERAASRIRHYRSYIRRMRKLNKKSRKILGQMPTEIGTCNP